MVDITQQTPSGTSSSPSQGFTGPSPRPSQITHPLWSPPLHNFTPTYHHDTYPSIHPRNFDLTSKSVLITGASRGIGLTTALRFAMAGCSRIAIVARSPLSSVSAAIKTAAREANQPEPDVLCLEMDVTSADSVRAAAEVVSARWGGGLDVLIANAGYSGEWVPLGEAVPDEWLKTVDVNLGGVYLVTRFFMPLLLKEAGGLKTLIVVGSIGAAGVDKGGSAYQVAKLAVSRFVEFVDQEYHDRGVLAVSVHPGGVATELGMMLPEEMHSYLVDTPELAGDGMVWIVGGGLRRDGKADGGRREWLGGRFVWVNWDVDELEGRREEVLERDLLKFRVVV